MSAPSATSAWRTRPRTTGHRCCPVLHALQGRIGWISEGGLNYACERLSVPPAEAYGVATFYAMFSVAAAARDRAARLRRPRLSHPRGRRDGGASRGRMRRRSQGGAEPLSRLVRGGAGGVVPGGGRGRHVPCRGAGRRRPDPCDDPRNGGARAAARAGAAPRRRAAAAACGRGGSDVVARLSRARRLRRAGTRDRARSRRRDPTGDQCEAPGPRRRRVPDGGQVARGGRSAREPQVRRRQRRRIGARHLQGPRAHGERSVRTDRGAHDRGVRDGGGDRLPVHPRRVPAGDETPARGDRGGAGGRPARARRHARGLRLRHRAAPRRRAPTSAGRRPRCSTRSRASAASRATSRRSP